MKHYKLVLLLLLATVSVFAQKERRYIRQGNRFYEKAVANSDSTHIDSVGFSNAETQYRKALEKKAGDFKSQFNLGNSLFKQNKMAESTSEYQQLLEAGLTKEDKGKTWFNYGNSLLAQQKLDESIMAYKNALKNNPDDLEAKYNLEFARKMKQQQQQQQQQNKDKQDQNKDKQDQNKDKQDQNKDQQNKNQQQQQQQSKISKQNAEQMLKALQNDESKTQEKVKKAEAMKAKST